MINGRKIKKLITKRKQKFKKRLTLKLAFKTIKDYSERMYQQNKEAQKRISLLKLQNCNLLSEIERLQTIVSEKETPEDLCQTCQKNDSCFLKQGFEKTYSCIGYKQQ